MESTTMTTVVVGKMKLMQIPPVLTKAPVVVEMNCNSWSKMELSSFDWSVEEAAENEKWEERHYSIERNSKNMYQLVVD